MKQKLRTLTRVLYILLDDCQWKITSRGIIFWDRLYVKQQ